METIQRRCVLANYLGIDGRFEMVWELWQKVEIQENKQLHLKKKLFENDIGVSTMNNAMKHENTIMLFTGCFSF